jgi:hypothetical protein
VYVGTSNRCKTTLANHLSFFYSSFHKEAIHDGTALMVC